MIARSERPRRRPHRGRATRGVGRPDHEERYSTFESDNGVTYASDVVDWVATMMGPDAPVNVGLRGGEALRVRDRTLDVLHTLGPTKGYLISYERPTTV